MGTFEGPYRKLDFKERQSGSYVTVYQRPKEEVRLDVVFFDGDIEIEEALLRKRLLDSAIEQARQWDQEWTGNK